MASELSHLFMSPQERERLAGNSNEPLSTPSSINSLYFNGYLKKRKGKPLNIWVNSGSKEKRVPSGISVSSRIQTQGQVSVKVNHQQILLRPGQKLELEFLKVKNLLQPVYKPQKNKTPASIIQKDETETKKTIATEKLLNNMQNNQL